MLQQPEAESGYSVLLTDLKFCSLRKDLRWGRKLHAKAVETWNDRNIFIMTALINMYTKCGSMVYARHVFDSVQKPNVLSWNALLLGYVDNGEGQAAVEMFSSMKAHGFLPDSVTYVAVLKACTSLTVIVGKSSCLERGREIHLQVGRHLNHYVQNSLMDMYAKCGSMAEARLVFDSIQKPDVVSWNIMLLGYAENGDGLVALETLSRMEAHGCTPDSLTYVAALKACTSLAVNEKKDCLELGREIHSKIGCHMNHYVQSTLICMYAKFGSMIDACYVFDSVQKPDLVSWNALIMGYVDNEDGQNALEMFSRMKACGCTPNSVTFIAVLKACSLLAVNGDETGKTSCLERGRKLHLQVDCHLNNYVQNTLIDMYSKCGSMDDARYVFNSVQKPDVVSWNALIMGYADNGDGLAALDMFSQMRTLGYTPSSVTYIAALKACALTGSLALGRKFHLEISEVNYACLQTCLVDFYAKCGSMIEARVVFDSNSKSRDASTWNALLAGYGSFGDSDSVLKLFEAMQDEGLGPNNITFVCILLCCGHAGLTKKAKEYFEAMHAQYKVTPTVMHYNCMVNILGRVNQLNEAIAMIQRTPCNPDAVTWRTLLGACNKWKNVKMGKLAFQSLVDRDKKDSSAYVVVAHLYGSVGMWEEQERVLESRTQVGAWKPPGQVYVMDDKTLLAAGTYDLKGPR